MTDTIVAEEMLDLQGAAALAEALRERRGKPVTLDTARVRHAGAAALQVLLAARAAWAADGQDFTLAQPSPALAAAIRLMGAEDALAGGAA